MMMFKNYSFQCASQAIYFAQDLKLGHYMKVPPRIMFWSQLVALSGRPWCSSLSRTGPQFPFPTSGRGPSVKPSSRVPAPVTFYTASVIWGAIGPPAYVLGRRCAVQQPAKWFWLIGAISPVITWLLARRYPRSIWRYISLPVLFGGAGWIPRRRYTSISCWGIVGTAFKFPHIRRRYMGWWLHLNYVTSAALDCGLVVSTLVIFFALYLSGVLKFRNGLVTSRSQQTLDMINRSGEDETPLPERSGRHAQQYITSEGS